MKIAITLALLFALASVVAYAAVCSDPGGGPAQLCNDDGYLICDQQRPLSVQLPNAIKTLNACSNTTVSSSDLCKPNPDAGAPIGNNVICANDAGAIDPRNIPSIPPVYWGVGTATLTLTGIGTGTVTKTATSTGTYTGYVTFTVTATGIGTGTVTYTGTATATGVLNTTMTSTGTLTVNGGGTGTLTATQTNVSVGSSDVSQHLLSIGRPRGAYFDDYGTLNANTVKGMAIGGGPWSALQTQSLGLVYCAGADACWWDVNAGLNTLQIRAMADNNLTGTVGLEFDRSGYLITNVRFPAGYVSVGTTGSVLGQLQLSGSTSGVFVIRPSAAAGGLTLTLPSSWNGGNKYWKVAADGTVTLAMPTASDVGALSGTVSNNVLPKGNAGGLQDSQVSDDGTNVNIVGGWRTSSASPTIGWPNDDAAAFSNTLNLAPTSTNKDGTVVLHGSGTATNPHLILSASSVPDTSGIATFGFGSGFAGARVGAWSFGSYLYAQALADGRDIDFVVSNASSGRVGLMTLAHSLRVGIRNTAPAYLLTIGSAGTIGGTIGIAGATSGYVTFTPAVDSSSIALNSQLQAPNFYTPTTAPSSGQFVKFTNTTGATVGANITEGDVTNLTVDLGNKVPTTRNIATINGLQGGGDLSADRTLAPIYGTTANTVAQGNDSRIVNALQANSIGDNVTWSVAKFLNGQATAVEAATPAGIGALAADGATGSGCTKINSASGKVTSCGTATPADVGAATTGSCSNGYFMTGTSSSSLTCAQPPSNYVPQSSSWNLRRVLSSINGSSAISNNMEWVTVYYTTISETPSAGTLDISTVATLTSTDTGGGEFCCLRIAVDDTPVSMSYNSCGTEVTPSRYPSQNAIVTLQSQATASVTGSGGGTTHNVQVQVIEVDGSGYGCNVAANSVSLIIRDYGPLQ